MATITTEGDSDVDVDNNMVTKQSVENHGYDSSSPQNSIGDEGDDDDADDGGLLDGASGAMPTGLDCAHCGNTLKEPKVLFCLHTFCDSCILSMREQQQLQTGDESRASTDSGAAMQSCDLEELQPRRTSPMDRPPPGVVRCPICHQDSNIGLSGTATQQLLPDFLRESELEANQFAAGLSVCTSCSSNEAAVQRCIDCARFLCQNCVEAHMHMRCFDNHKLVSLQTMKDKTDFTTFHKPAQCPLHRNERLNFYCGSCQVPVCNECMSFNHRPSDHKLERITDELSAKTKGEIATLVNGSRRKARFCENAAKILESATEPVHSYVDGVRQSIEESFNSYRDVLRRAEQAMLDRLESLHQSEENNLQEMVHRLYKASERVDDSCTFTERLLEQGMPAELLAFRSTITSQLYFLANNVPIATAPGYVQFINDPNEFERALEAAVGRFAVQKDKEIERDLFSQYQQTMEPAPQNPPIPAAAFALPSSNAAAATFNKPPPPMPNFTNNAFPAGAMPDQMQANFDGLMRLMGGGGAAPNATHTAEPIRIPPQYPTAAGEHRALPPATGWNPPAPFAPPATEPPTTQGLTAVGVWGSAFQAVLNNNMDNMSVQDRPGEQSNRIASPTNSGSGSGGAVNGIKQPPQIRGQRSYANNPYMGNHTMVGGLGANALAGQCYRPPVPNPPAPPPQGNSIILPPHLSGAAPQPPQNVMPNGGSAGGGGGGVFANTTAGQLSSLPQPNPNPPVRQGRMNPMHIRIKFGSLGPAPCQFNSPHGFCLGVNEHVVVADTNNHRIQMFDKEGTYLFSFGVAGKEEGQLWYPRKVAVIDMTGEFVVCDRGNERSRMQVFNRQGVFIKKIAIRYIDIVAGLAVTADQKHVVAVDSVSPTLFRINLDNGELSHWFDMSEYMREPSDVSVRGNEYYVCDFKGHCVVVFSEQGQFLRRIGCENVTNFPNGIDVSEDGDVLVGDSHGNRFHVAVFQKDGNLLSEFECPYIKVSRCCGLKITKEGYIVTLAKNNHHVLLLNTLYVNPERPHQPPTSLPQQSLYGQPMLPGEATSPGFGSTGQESSSGFLTGQASSPGFGTGSSSPSSIADPRTAIPGLPNANNILAGLGDVLGNSSSSFNAGGFGGSAALAGLPNF